MNAPREVSQLVGKLIQFADDSTPGELADYKLLLGLAAGGLAPDGEVPTHALKANSLRTVLACVQHISPSGVLWRGRPEFVTDELLADLRVEAAAARPDAIAHDQHFLGFGGETANKFANSEALASFVQQHAGDTAVEATGVASYLWYDHEGCGLPPHVDTEVFALNVILMIDHEYRDSPSRLQIFHPDQPRQDFVLESGEVLLLFAGGTVHAREPVKAGESVSIVTVGFRQAESSWLSA